MQVLTMTPTSTAVPGFTTHFTICVTRDSPVTSLGIEYVFYVSIIECDGMKQGWRDRYLGKNCRWTRILKQKNWTHIGFEPSLTVTAAAVKEQEINKGQKFSEMQRKKNISDRHLTGRVISQWRRPSGCPLPTFSPSLPERHF